MNKGKHDNFTRGEGLFENFLAKQRAALANRLIPEKLRKGRILDIGCGTYPYFLTVAHFKEKFGIDYSVNSKGISKNMVLKKINMEKTSMPFKDGYFNVITMLAVFEHINKDKLQAVLKDVRRVLSKDGLFIITTPSPWSDKILHLMARSGLISQEEIHDHKHNMTRAGIESLLTEAGFKRQNIKKGYFEVFLNMWFVAKK